MAGGTADWRVQRPHGGVALGHVPPRARSHAYATVPNNGESVEPRKIMAAIDNVCTNVNINLGGENPRRRPATSTWRPIHGNVPDQ